MDVFERLGDILNPNNSEVFRTALAVDKITGSCVGCHEPKNVKDLQQRKYLHPYTKKYTSGLFCKSCLNDPDIKLLVR